MLRYLKKWVCAVDLKRKKSRMRQGGRRTIMKNSSTLCQEFINVRIARYLDRNDLDLRIDLVLDHVLDRHQRAGQ